MKIEISRKKGDSNKAKGDLLENISKDLLKAQGYEVIEEIRFTGVELDLLCKHKVNGKQIYVECKAQKDKIGAPILRQLLGTVTGYDYAEGWLVSTSEFGKEAKGFAEMWKEKPLEISSKLSFYSPELVIDSLHTANVICSRPIKEAEKIANGSEFLGDWILLVTDYGRFWAVYTLQAGVPFGVLFFNAKSGRHIQEEGMLNNLSNLDSNITEFNLQIGALPETNKSLLISTSLPKVVEVQVGDSWDDYRPARPQDFVGRDNTQKDILSLLNTIRENKSDTRIFAITGNSGLGKSSLIAKLRERSKNKFYKNRFFVFAIDIRGATTPSYITSGFLRCLQKAQKSGFGDNVDLQLTDPSAPSY
jgi:hypothetical protein